MGREDDRVAIHEAMEQQTISIAKAGITTTLNSRCSVLAAANSIFGRWDDSKAEENIDFMPTILSRFDTIFIVKDEHNEERDITLAKHVMSIHVNAGSAAVRVGRTRRGRAVTTVFEEVHKLCPGTVRTPTVARSWRKTEEQVCRDAWTDQGGGG